MGEDKEVSGAVKIKTIDSTDTTIEREIEFSVGSLVNLKGGQFIVSAVMGDNQVVLSGIPLAGLAKEEPKKPIADEGPAEEIKDAGDPPPPKPLAV